MGLGGGFWLGRPPLCCGVWYFFVFGVCFGFGRRVSPRQASYFFLLRQKDVTKKKATPEAAPQALRAWGPRVCHARRGGEKTRPAGSNSFRLKSPAANVAAPVRPMGPQQHSPSAWVGTALPAGRLPCWDARVLCAPCGLLAVLGCPGALQTLESVLSFAFSADCRSKLKTLGTRQWTLGSARQSHPSAQTTTTGRRVSMSSLRATTHRNDDRRSSSTATRAQSYNLLRG